MKLLIAVKSCQRDKALGFHNVVRETWGAEAKRLGIDVRFFVGKNMSRYESDEVHLECPDDYNGLPYKTRAICRWVSGKAIDHTFLCDIDTYVSVVHLLQSGFEHLDYFGYFNSDMYGTKPYTALTREGVQEHHPQCYNWASGGFGYSLSKNAISEIAFEHPTSYAEDLWVGQVLGPLIASGEMKVDNTKGRDISWHHPNHGEIYDLAILKSWMTQMHKEHK